jgi:hypothetical protein
MKNWLLFAFFFAPTYILGMHSGFSQEHRIRIRSTSDTSSYRKTANAVRSQRRHLHSSLQKHQANVSKVQTKSDSLPARDTDFITTTPSAIINISPEVDSRVRDRLSVLDGVRFETFEQRVRAVGEILENMERNGELTPVQKQNLLARGIRTYLRRLSDPVGMAKDQLNFMLNVARFSCGILVDYHFPTQAAIERRKEQLRKALSLFSHENLSKIPEEHWVDLIATIAADITVTGGVSATIAYIKQAETFGKASIHCMKLAQKVDQKVSQAGIKVGRYMEDKLVAAAARGEQVVTVDGIVLNVPPRVGEASVLKNAMKEGASSSISTVGKEAVAKVEYNFTKTAGSHLNEVVQHGKYRGELVRPYMRSPLTVQEIIATGKGVPDATALNALNFRVPGTFRGSKGIWELVVDTEEKLIYHFLFKTESL